MVTALSWKNVRAFDRWIDSIRLLQHSCDNTPEVMLAFIENMPTPWHCGSPSGNGKGKRLCCSETGASSSYQAGNDSTVVADEQQALGLLERDLELVGTR